MKSNPPPYGDPFVVQWEIPNPRDQLERLYIVFNGIQEYRYCLDKGRYQTCHEVLIGPSYDTSDDIVGHPAFDLDLKVKDFDGILPMIDGMAQFPDGWIYAFEQDLIQVFKAQYPSISWSMDMPAFVWLTSPSSIKASKHLIIQGITLITWRAQMKILIKGLRALLPPRPYLQALDEGIYRKFGSLRLPLNTKKSSTSRLLFDNPKHRFEDGLIMIHNQISNNSRMLWASDLDPILQEEDATLFMTKPKQIIKQDLALEAPMERAWAILEARYHTGLESTPIKGSYMALQRVHPGPCPISGRIHEHDNAYLFAKGPLIFYACHRGCSINIEGKEHKAIDITPHISSNSDITAHQILSTMKEPDSS